MHKNDVFFEDVIFKDVYIHKIANSEQIFYRKQNVTWRLV